MTRIIPVDSNEGSTQALPIYTSREIQIPIKVTDFIRYVDLKFATYCKVLFGRALFSFKIGPLVKAFDLDLADVKDNAFIKFDLGEHVQGKTLTISIVTKYRRPDHLAIWYSGSNPTYKFFKEEGYSVSLVHKPLISIATGVYNPNPVFLIQTAESVFSQKYDNWEWILVDDHSTEDSVRNLLNSFAKKDSRVKVVLSTVNEGISEAQNKALKAGTGEWFLVLDHDDVLHKDALLDIALEASNNSAVQLIYSDEDKIDSTGAHSSPFYKPDWSPALLLSQNYVCHLCAFKLSELRKRCPKGYEKEYDGSQDYRLLLEYAKGGVTTTHISKVLYHWRIHAGSTSAGHQAKPGASIAAKKAIKSYLSTFDIIDSCEILSTEYAGVYRPFVTVKKDPLVSIIIPTKDHPELIVNTLDSLLKTDYGYFGVTLVDNGSDLSVMQPIYDKYSELFIEQGGRDFKLIYEKGPFNFSAQVNTGASSTSSVKYLLLLNNDVEILSPSWLKELVWPMEVFHDVGAVGARLLYPNGTLQHAGVLMGVGGIAGHCHKHLPLGKAGYFSRVMTLHEVSAVTGACLLVRKEVFSDVGGLCESMPSAFNDVDFCLKIRKAGHRILYQPWSVLYHYESASRGVDAGNDPIFLAAIKTMQNRWAAEIAYDPYFHQQFSRNSEVYVYQ